MSLTTGNAPLAATPGDSNYSIESPAHRLFMLPVTRRIRAELDGRTVLDTREARLLYETGIRARLYVPVADFLKDALVASDETTYCPFKGTATYRSVRAGDRTSEDAIWVYDEPNPETPWLKGYAGVYEERFDRWLDEDDEVVGSLPDPFHRVDVRHTSRHIRVSGADGVVLADSTAALLVSETSTTDRFYLPRADVKVDLAPSDRTWTCPYKGHATYYSVPGAEDVAWSYESPLAEAAPLAGYISFAGDGIEVAEVSSGR
ncbi:MAG: DUF427 domain-containing protein [Gaiellales bacterium]